MTNWHRPSPAQPNPPQSYLPLLTEVKPVSSATNREKTMKYIKKTMEKNMLNGYSKTFINRLCG